MIIQVSGKLRQGKGVLMVLFALIFAMAGGLVYANFTIKHPNCRKIDFYDLLSLLKAPRSLVPILIVIDELPTWIDSYVSTTSESSRMAGHFCNQSAKLNYHMIYSCQRTKRADINYREMVDLAYKARKYDGYFEYTLLDDSDISEDIETDTRIDLPFSVASRFWDYYDTFERVIPIGLDDLLIKMEKSDPVRLMQTVGRLVELLRVRDLGLRSVAQTKVALAKLGESTVFADLVYAELSNPRLESLKV